MDNAVEEIKQKLDVVEILGDYLRLAKAGRNFKARCPFHNERTASLMVSPERQIWHCFGCGVGGDIFGFIMKVEGLEFVDALRLLAQKAGVTLKRQNQNNNQAQSQKKRLYEVCELAAKFFETQLFKSAAGKKPLAYLKERGLKDASLTQWRLGWAPDKWRALYEFLKTRGYKDEEILSAGLAVKPEEDLTKNQKLQTKNCYDRFRSRIIFPIFDLQGQVIAFGGRIFGEGKSEETAKYLNSPQTPLYDKSSVLYGLNRAKGEIRSQDKCLIVEGYMDLIMAHQADVKNAVASSGTALTENHLKIIGRYTKNLTMAFDSDEAGGLATQRSIDLALQRDFEVRIILMKDKDPADLIKKNPTSFKAAMADAVSIKDFYFSRTLAKYDIKTAEGKKQIRKTLLPVIKSLASRTEQSEWLKDLASCLRAEEKDLLADLAATKTPLMDERQAPDLSQKPVAAPLKPRLVQLEERFVGLCLNCPPMSFDELAISEKDFSDEALGQIFQGLKKGQKEKDWSEELKLKIDYLAMQL
ncbi:MAG: DNA primase, partial [Patescibacteria group bacterium]